jgi:RNA polymerase sigma-70 factor (ECF subfamily)
MTEAVLEAAELRPLMFSVAYRMLGSVVEAEDVVQDAFVRMHTMEGTAPEQVRNPEAFATTVTTRLAIDVLRSARHRRELYVGSWLPEPILASDGDDPAQRIELDESVSMAMLTLLEELSPEQRAVFVLREAFDYEYADIAEVLKRSEAACRQLLRRAHQRLQDHQVRFEASAEDRRRLSETFLEAIRTGDLTAMEAVLVEDVELVGDGGGKAPAVSAPVQGRLQVARFLLGLSRLAERHGFALQATTVNGQPGALMLAGDELLGVMSLDIGPEGVRGVHNQINPDKLRHLGRRVGDLAGLLSGEA